MLIDSHAHLNFRAFKKDLEEVIKRTLKNEVWVINVGTQYDTAKKAVEIAEKYKKGIYAAVGLHPIHLETGLLKIKNDTEEIKVKTKEEKFDYEKYKNLAKSKKVVAIGETGLDYYWRPKTAKKKELFRQKQKELLLNQLKLAKELELPVIFHCRMAHNDFIEILKPQTINSRLRGVVHCFSGTWQQAEKYLKMGLYLGFNGIIFKLNLEDVIKKTPLDRILIETDCPYLIPPQESGRNEPVFVKYVVEKIAEIKGVRFKDVAEISAENAKKLFNL